MEANEYQVGGNHYQSNYQHWDFVIDANLNYLEGCATKYVSRHRDKNGLEDLQKSIHYIAKLEESGLANTMVKDGTVKKKIVNLAGKLILLLSKHHKTIHIANWLSDKITASLHGKIKYNKRMHSLYKFCMNLPHAESNIVQDIVNGNLDKARENIAHIIEEKYRPQDIIDIDSPLKQHFFKG